MIGIETDEIINKLFKSLLTNYLEGLKYKIKSSNFALQGWIKLLM